MTPDDPRSTFIPAARFKDALSSVRHYYGDVVRVLFLAVAILLGASMFLSDNVIFGVFASAPAVLVLVVLAGYMNPHGKLLFLLSSIVAGLGVLSLEVFAAAAFVGGNYVLTTALGIAWVLSIVALYFSVKNLRAAYAHKIGSIDGVGEFDEIE